MADRGRGDANGQGGGADVGKSAAADAQMADANVVPFPRDWIGPLDELVPIDLGPAPAASSGDAAGFWGGDISGEREAPEPEWGEEPRADARPQRSSDPAPPHASQGRRRGLALSGCGVLLVAALAAVLLVTSGLGSSHDGPGVARPDRQVRTLTETVTAPAGVTTTASVSAGRSVKSGVLIAATTEHGTTRAKRKSSSQSARGDGGDPTGETGSRSAAEAGDQSSDAEGGTSPSVTTDDVVANGQTPGGRVVTSGRAVQSPKSRAGSTCVQSPDSGCLP